ncbi:TetR/AcrR family transcriptional regulator [Phytohabitans houttuyneae]|uniref:TetR family transcriptional regulator n=1 Tax=Phytohabitans houttuyneae TaxID=1076126 RepID=A0A6V8K5K3_9ACTN|nr:TetR/AcrR family transcriptional regulator [Phytohabitans houttuyneae]GFJ76085.1 TetR family transcriptional regulator [Phytohabitans houttuyneae]
MVDTQDTASRARTRQAIIDAAIAVLGKNLSAPLGEVATAAEVGRTTLHRYYPERSDLIKAIKAESVLRLRQATERARLDEGTGAEALRRLCEEYFDLGNVLSLIFSEHQFLTEADWCEFGTSEDLFRVTVERGHRDGSIDPELPVSWLESVLWSQLYAAWSYAAESGESRHQVLRLTVRTLAGAIAPREA